MGTVFSVCTELLVAGERFIIWTALSTLLCCVMTMLTIMLFLGIGIGFNYCYVDKASRYRYVPEQYYYPDSPRWPYRGGELEGIDEGLKPHGKKKTLLPVFTSSNKGTTTTNPKVNFALPETLGTTMAKGRKRRRGETDLVSQKTTFPNSESDHHLKNDTTNNGTTTILMRHLISNLKFGVQP